MHCREDFVVVIPARYDSTRLPGKPLVKIKGKELLLRTYQQCSLAVPDSKIFVATDSNKIKDFCDLNNIQVVMTSQDCLTGTDRVAEFSNYIDASIYINVQGDEPLINPSDIQAIIKESLQNQDIVLNGFCKINTIEDFLSPNIPKVTFSNQSKLLYMSRSPIPINKSGDFIDAFRQVCIYAFPKKSLDLFSKHPKTFFEQIEDIEILRFLELDQEVKMIQLTDDSIAVDVPEDILKVEMRLS